jgi:hypothetical protein
VAGPLWSGFFSKARLSLLHMRWNEGSVLCGSLFRILTPRFSLVFILASYLRALDIGWGMLEKSQNKSGCF